MNAYALRREIEKENVRESKKTIFTQKIQIKQVNKEEIVPGATIEADFSLMLPADLPSSMLYCGRLFSEFKVKYWMTATFVGLKQESHN